MRNSKLLVTATFIVAAAACTTSEQSPSADSAASASAASTGSATDPIAAVRIVSQTDGDSVSQPFTVRLEATGVEVIPATGTREPGKGHHHLVIDGNASDDTLPLPAAPLVIHMGTGATERVLDSLSAGPHRIIAIFASGDHVPMTTVKRDTITVVVR